MIATTMFDDGQEPGDYGFDPLELSTKPAAELEKYKLQEIKHGRLAMIAMIVLMRQSAVLHAGVPFHAGGIPFIT
ncbi:unnamed protein product [Scytosiphon promiscuus]